MTTRVPLAVIHLLAIQAARTRHGWIYVVPLGLFWVIVIIAVSGGIPSSWAVGDPAGF